MVIFLYEVSLQSQDIIWSIIDFGVKRDWFTTRLITVCNFMQINYSLLKLEDVLFYGYLREDTFSTNLITKLGLSL